MLPQNIARYPNCFLTLTHEQISNPCWGPSLSTHDPGIWIGSPPSFPRGFPDCSVIKNLPTIQETQETWVQFLGWENPLEEEMATHSSILAWKILWARGTWWATVHGVAKSQDTSDKHFHFPIQKLQKFTGRLACHIVVRIGNYRPCYKYLIQSIWPPHAKS